MNEEVFWEYIGLIDESTLTFSNKWEREEMQMLLLEKALEKHPFEEVLEFHRILFQKLYDLFLPKIAELFW